MVTVANSVSVYPVSCSSVVWLQSEAILFVLVLVILSPCHTQMHCRGPDSSNAVIVLQVTLKYVEALIGCTDAVTAVAVTVSVTTAMHQRMNWRHCRGHFSVFYVLQWLTRRS